MRSWLRGGVLFLWTAWLALSGQGCQKDPEPTEPVPESPPVPSECSVGFWYDGACRDPALLPTWGLGETQTEYVHVDRDYAWYIDQLDTGRDALNNCGPTSCVMAARWYSRSFAGTVEQARAMIPNDGGWWYTNDILRWLEASRIPHEVRSYAGSDQLTEILREGKLIIICLNTARLRPADGPERRVDRFYGYADGHFLVLKGARRTDQGLFFESYDPFTGHLYYADHSQKGMDRHYRAADLSQAILQWWPYLIVVESPVDAAKGAQEVDPRTVPNQWGR